MVVYIVVTMMHGHINIKFRQLYIKGEKIKIQKHRIHKIEKINIVNKKIYMKRIFKKILKCKKC